MERNPYESPRVAVESGQDDADDTPWAFALFFYLIAGLNWITVLTAIN
jgi:hypothetical protein